jgi:thiol:disulfide interchange protein DsbD
VATSECIAAGEFYCLFALWHSETCARSQVVVCSSTAKSGLAYAYQQYQWWQGQNTVGTSAQVQWHVAKTAAEFQALLAQAPQGQPIVVDVYAEWCVACQPIEHHILPQPQVQQALAPFYLIKLDLSQYDASHQALLSQWDILGPPTYLFLDTQHRELRGLRLTGEFKIAGLLQRLQQLAQKRSDWRANNPLIA